METVHEGPPTALIESYIKQTLRRTPELASKESELVQVVMTRLGSRGYLVSKKVQKVIANMKEDGPLYESVVVGMENSSYFMNGRTLAPLRRTSSKILERGDSFEDQLDLCTVSSLGDDGMFSSVVVSTLENSTYSGRIGQLSPIEKRRSPLLETASVYDFMPKRNQSELRLDEAEDGGRCNLCPIC